MQQGGEACELIAAVACGSTPDSRAAPGLLDDHFGCGPQHRLVDQCSADAMRAFRFQISMKGLMFGPYTSGLAWRPAND